MVEETEEKEKENVWETWFNMLLSPFAGNCYILLKATKGKIEVKAVAADPDSKKELDYIM